MKSTIKQLKKSLQTRKIQASGVYQSEWKQTIARDLFVKCHQHWEQNEASWRENQSQSSRMALDFSTETLAAGPLSNVFKMVMFSNHEFSHTLRKRKKKKSESRIKRVLDMPYILGTKTLLYSFSRIPGNSPPLKDGSKYSNCVCLPPLTHSSSWTLVSFMRTNEWSQLGVPAIPLNAISQGCSCPTECFTPNISSSFYPPFLTPV